LHTIYKRTPLLSQDFMRSGSTYNTMPGRRKVRMYHRRTSSDGRSADLESQNPSYFPRDGVEMSELFISSTMTNGGGHWASQFPLSDEVPQSLRELVIHPNWAFIESELGNMSNDNAAYHAIPSLSDVVEKDPFQLLLGHMRDKNEWRQASLEFADSVITAVNSGKVSSKSPGFVLYGPYGTGRSVAQEAMRRTIYNVFDRRSKANQSWGEYAWSCVPCARSGHDFYEPTGILLSSEGTEILAERLTQGQISRRMHAHDLKMNAYRSALPLTALGVGSVAVLSHLPILNLALEYLSEITYQCFEQGGIKKMYEGLGSLNTTAIMDQFSINPTGLNATINEIVGLMGAVPPQDDDARRQALLNAVGHLGADIVGPDSLDLFAFPEIVDFSMTDMEKAGWAMDRYFDSGFYLMLGLGFLMLLQPYLIYRLEQSQAQPYIYKEPVETSGVISGNLTEEDLFGAIDQENVDAPKHVRVSRSHLADALYDVLTIKNADLMPEEVQTALANCLETGELFVANHIRIPFLAFVILITDSPEQLDDILLDQRGTFRTYEFSEAVDDVPFYTGRHFLSLLKHWTSEFDVDGVSGWSGGAMAFLMKSLRFTVEGEDKFHMSEKIIQVIREALATNREGIVIQDHIEDVWSQHITKEMIAGWAIAAKRETSQEFAAFQMQDPAGGFGLRLRV
jgi:hypothetical protein